MAQSTWYFWTAVGVGLLTGVLLGMQPSANGFLGRNVEHPLQASVISFASGTALLVLVTLALGCFPPKLKVAVDTMPWWAWIGGAIGTVMVTASLIFVHTIGSLTWFAVVITGQVLAALLLDHFGWMGNSKQPASPMRLIGACMLIAGIGCITYSRRPTVVKPEQEQAAEAGDVAMENRPHQGRGTGPHDAVEQLGEHLAEES